MNLLVEKAERAESFDSAAYVFVHLSSKLSLEFKML
jgi:hypothetical protein